MVADPLCECGHARARHDYTGDEHEVGWGACEEAGCPCGAFVEAEAVECPDCRGTGEHEVAPERRLRRDQPIYVLCDRCKGSGAVMENGGTL